MTGATGFSARLEGYRDRIARLLDRHLPPAEHHPARLHQAMRYANTGGKRLRALLAYATAETLGLPPERVDACACAVELIHAYSLVHDDLPAMDDDDLRRGQPTVHKQFDEATAILVGDALQSLAFCVLAQSELPSGCALQMVATLALAAGSQGMVGGQAIDLASEHQALSLAELEALHIRKTGALIRACLLLPCHADPAIADDTRDALDHFGKCLGLAFQIQDDILDVEGSSADLGKTAGKDEASHKSTYPAVMGMRAAKERAGELFADAMAALAPLGEAAEPLRVLADRIRGRDR